MKGLILTGGRSTRMGHDKGTATLRGRPLVEYVIGCFSSFCDELFVSVGANRDLYARWERDGIARLIVDDSPDQGPVGALAAAAQVIRADLVAVSSGDSPFVTREFYEMLGERAQGFDGAVPLIGGRHEPLHAVYAARALPEWARCLSEGRLRPIHAFDRLKMRFVSEEECRAVDPELQSLVNLNTPEELDFWERKLQKERPR